MPSRSVEAATRDEAIAAAREEFGPAARVVGVRRIRSGGMFGFFASERYVAEVELPRTPEPATATPKAPRRATAAAAARAAQPSLADRMDELSDLLGDGPAEEPAAGLYSRVGAARVEESPAAPSAAAAPAARPAAGLFGTSLREQPAEPARTPASPSRGSSAGQRRPTEAARPAQPAASASTAKPFTPARHTLMLSPDELTAPPAQEAEPATGDAAPSPFAAALTRMVSSDAQVQSAVADVAEAEAAAAEAARLESAAADAARREAADAEAARIEAAAAQAVAAEAARLQAARLEAAAAEAARLEAARITAEAEAAAAAEAARIKAEAEAEAAAEAARIRAEAEAEAAAEATRIRAEAEAAAAEAAAEAARVREEAEAAAAAEAARLEAARVEAAQLEAARLEAARVQAEAEAAEANARAAAEEARQAAEAEAAAEAGRRAAPQSMVDSVRSADDELADLLEQVLAANGSGRGRHRFPEPVAEVPAAPEAPATTEFALPGLAGARPAVPPVRDVPQPWAYAPAGLDEDVDGPGAGNLDADESATGAYDTGAYRTDDRGQWTTATTGPQRVVDAVLVEEAPRRPVAREAEPLADHRVAAPLASAALARTASDPAPLPLDATTVLPPLSLLPPQHHGGPAGAPPLLRSRPAVPPARGGRPPVPPVRPAGSRLPLVTRPVRIELPAAPTPAADPAPVAEPEGQLATVTRLVPVRSAEVEPYAVSLAEEFVIRLLTLGVPHTLLGADFLADVAARGVYAALTRTLVENLPPAPRFPVQPGEVLLVVGPGAETFATARALALTLRLDPETVQWASSGALAQLAPEASRISSLETALERRRASASAGTVTIVAVDAPLRTAGGPWLEHMLAVWSPTAVWAVLDSTRKPEDLVPWLDGLPRVDAVVVQDTDSTADPAAVLGHLQVPVALIDGARATAHRWASLLCERLEELEA